MRHIRACYTRKERRGDGFELMTAGEFDPDNFNRVPVDFGTREEAEAHAVRMGWSVFRTRAQARSALTFAARRAG